MPMTTISPSRTRRRLTMPSIGDAMEVLASMSLALVCCARACTMRRAAASAVCRARSIVARTEVTCA
jgi:hypothetical protein